jgi:hypothetical protein
MIQNQSAMASDYFIIPAIRDARTSETRDTPIGSVTP